MITNPGAVLRVFPRRTTATPEDDLAFVGAPPAQIPDAEEVHVSCTFTWDKPEAERLVELWSAVHPIVRLGGPAFDDPGGNFMPGMYLKPGYVLTSRGCRRACKFCFVPKREGKLRLLPIRDGWDVVDNNILATPREHQTKVFAMLARQPKRAKFTGGLEARLLTEWHVRQFKELKVSQVFFAYDRPYERPWVKRAFSMMREVGFKRDRIYCYVLVGYEGDTKSDAEIRLQWVKSQKVTPFAMYFRGPDSDSKRPKEWGAFVRSWSRPAAIWAKECFN